MDTNDSDSEDSMETNDSDWDDSSTTENSDSGEEIRDFLDLEVASVSDLKLDQYSKQKYYSSPKQKCKYEPSSQWTNKSIQKYINKMRDKLIGEIKKGQEAALKNYDKIKNELKVDKSASDEEIDRNVASRLFENQFMFLLLDMKSKFKNRNTVFELYLVRLDFYLNKRERQQLK